MTEENNQGPTEEERKETAEKEVRRGAALHNLSSDGVIMNLALPEMIRQSGLLSEEGGRMIGNEIYEKVFENITYKDVSGRERNFMAEIINSRREGENQSEVERYITAKAGQIFNGYVGFLKAGDLISMAGISGVNMKPEYEAMGGEYLSDVLEKSGDEGKEFIEKIMGGYRTDVITSKISESFRKLGERNRGGLEDFLSAPPKTETESESQEKAA